MGGSTSKANKMLKECGERKAAGGEVLWQCGVVNIVHVLAMIM